MNESAFREHFQACFKELQHTGEFAFSNTESQYVNPGLHVQGVGAIGLPLATRDAESIAAVCKQSPFGRNDETIVDETVRKTWELNATKFTCTNPSWVAYLDKLATTAVDTLGVRNQAQAQLYKLLLYGPGAFFKAHRDTERVPKMFGTLVVCLPSPHTGGEVILRHCGKTRTIVTANTSGHDLCTSAWYSDVQHEISPVHTGYRLVLIYNLVQTDASGVPSAAEKDRHSSLLSKQLQSWLQQYPHIDHYIWPLEHQYTKEGLSLHHLKGRDASVCGALERLCSMNGVWWFLAKMTRSKKDEDAVDDGYGYDDEDAESDRLSTICTPFGREVSLKLKPLTQDNVLVDMNEYYADRSPDSEDEGEFLGNEGTANTLRYHNTTVVLVQKDVVINSICRLERGSASLSALHELVSKDIHLTAVQQCDAMVNILKTSFEMLKRGFVMPVEGKEYIELIKLTAEHCYSMNEGLRVAELLHILVPEDQYDFYHDQWYPLLVQTVVPYVAEQVRADQEGAWNKWLAIPLPRHPTYTYIKNRRILFDAVRQQLSPNLAAAFDQKVHQELNRLAGAVTITNAGDVAAVLDLIAVLGPEACSSAVIPGLIQKPNSAFLLDFMASVAARNSSHRSKDLATIHLFFKPLIPIITQNCKLTIQNLSRHQTPYAKPYSTPERGLMEAVFRVIEICIESGLQEEGEQLLKAILPDIPYQPPQTWAVWQLLFMVVEHLLTLLFRQRNERLNQCGRQFVTEVVQIAVRDAAQTRPVVPQGWERSVSLHQPCTCAACQAFADFARDKNLRFHSFSFAKKTREHLRYQIVHSEDFKFENDRTGRTHSLIITKTTNQYSRERKKWEEDVKAIKFALTSMRHEFTYELLNGDVVGISGIDRLNQQARPAPQPLEPSTASAQNILPPPIAYTPHAGQTSARPWMGQGQAPAHNLSYQQNARMPYAPTTGTKRSSDAAGLDRIDLTQD